MKDVSWGDVLWAVFLSPVLIFPPLLVVYLVLFVLLGLSPRDYSSWMSLAVIPTCLVEGLILARLYKGEEDPIEHGWAWLAAVAVVAGVSSVPYAAGLISAETAADLALVLYAEIAGIFLIVMLAVFINSRRNAPRPIERREVDLQRDTKAMLLKRL